jgi:hypothetical protein
MDLLRERERERREIGGGGVVREIAVLGMGGNRNKICGFEGSQAVPASRSGRGEACMWDLFIIIKKNKLERLQWGEM